MGLFSKLAKTDNATKASITTCKDGNKWWASFEFYPFATGSSKTTFDAMMYIPNDYWSRTKSVVKAKNDRFGVEAEMNHEVRISEIADEFASKFQKQFDDDRFTRMRRLRFIRPFLAEMDSVSAFNVVFRYLKQYDKSLTEGEYVLIEPYIGQDFTSFIYPNGVVSSCCPELLQSFCHFSYHESNGDFVISNLQGTFSDGIINLSSPRIHSRDQAFGDRDMGMNGISEFFAHHKCNSVCQNFLGPDDGPVVCASPFDFSKKFEYDLSTRESDFAYVKDPLPTVKGQEMTQPTGPPPYQFVDKAKVQEYLIKYDLPAVHNLCLKDT